MHGFSGCSLLSRNLFSIEQETKRRSGHVCGRRGRGQPFSSLEEPFLLIHLLLSLQIKFYLSKGINVPLSQSNLHRIISARNYVESRLNQISEPDKQPDSASWQNPLLYTRQCIVTAPSIKTYRKAPEETIQEKNDTADNSPQG